MPSAGMVSQRSRAADRGRSVAIACWRGREQIQCVTCSIDGNGGNPDGGSSCQHTTSTYRLPSGMARQTMTRCSPGLRSESGTHSMALSRLVMSHLLFCGRCAQTYGALYGRTRVIGAVETGFCGTYRPSAGAETPSSASRWVRSMSPSSCTNFIRSCRLQRSNVGADHARRSQSASTSWQPRAARRPIWARACKASVMQKEPLAAFPRFLRRPDGIISSQSNADGKAHQSSLFWLRFSFRSTCPLLYAHRTSG
jgi:hypothetical protein